MPTVLAHWREHVIEHVAEKHEDYSDIDVRRIAPLAGATDIVAEWQFTFGRAMLSPDSYWAEAPGVKVSLTRSVSVYIHDHPLKPVIEELTKELGTRFREFSGHLRQALNFVAYVLLFLLLAYLLRGRTPFF
jgi:hypothetical protein